MLQHYIVNSATRKKLGRVGCLIKIFGAKDVDFTLRLTTILDLFNIYCINVLRSIKISPKLNWLSSTLHTWSLMNVFSSHAAKAIKSSKIFTIYGYSDIAVDVTTFGRFKFS